MREVHVYVTDTLFLEDEGTFRKIYEKMPAYRRKKVDAYHFQKDRRLSLAAGYLLSEALFDAGVDEKELVYAVTKNGHPYFCNRKDLVFSLSHSGERALCVLGTGFEGEVRGVGCDVETEAGNEDVDIDRWTAMESYLKATDGVIDELLDFDPEMHPEYSFFDVACGENDGYRYKICVPYGADIRYHFNNREKAL